MTERINNPNMTTLEIVEAMSGRNPGAVAACAEILARAARIDPDAFCGGLTPLLSLDTLGVYGPRIYELWNDVCGRDVGKLVALLRGWQLGLDGVDAERLNHAIDNRGAGIDVDAVVDAVKARLPKFDVSAR